MKFPEGLTVTALEQGTDDPIERLAVVLELFATKKNDYIVGPAISDSKGQVQFTREECKRSIKADKEMFLMDYLDEIEDCKPHLEVRLHSPEHIAGMLRQYKTAPAFWGQRFQNPVQLFHELEHAKNSAFEPASVRVSESQILVNPNITMRIRRKT